MAHSNQAATLTKALISLISNTQSYDEVCAYMASHKSLSDPTMRKRVVSGQAGDYCTPLITACIMGKLCILQYLLEQGANPNVP
ncbi:uncharacterized protein ACA1_156330 [Acanthamoeba castellanii str. Neff]|uniref:Uncharacterized protein n=1 Tax=Acanthamoeba castellanii (strain ATCC 30010 / Neff) TaxID=1257118 RepID=L8GK22_ACACF|nr:uncharacterized protein ACA1_156330 [Acanthamoeba castellanii str. Neff]ELR12531.1 hypothetical protein ACA1_156330 [Acanthamoeba castellanii str. Neff]